MIFKCLLKQTAFLKMSYVWSSFQQQCKCLIYLLPEWKFLCYIFKSVNFYWINRKMVLFSLLFLENIFFNFLFIFLEAYIDFALQISYWQNWKKFKQKYPSVLEIRIHGKKTDSNFRKKNVSVFLKCPNFSRMSSFSPRIS